MTKKSFPYTAEYDKFVRGFGYGNGNQLRVGDVIYPIEREWDSGETMITYSDRPGRTNMSHEERVSGWLGCTNDVHETALGEYEIVGITSRTIQCKRLDK
jgi:hypothetical protein